MIKNAATCWDPLWARYDQEGPPNWSAAMSGVLYGGLHHDAVFDYLSRSDIKAAFCAVGRRLWPGEQGPWLHYSVDRLDRNLNKKVRERAWPWCLGDEVVFIAQGKCGLGLVDVELNDPYRARAFFEPGTTPESQSLDLFIKKADKWVGHVIGPFARLVHGPLQPPQSWRPPQAQTSKYATTTGRLRAPA